MKTKIVLIGIVVALIATKSFSEILGSGFDFPADDRWRKSITKLYEDLKLTDEQKSKLQNLFFEFRKNQAEIAGKLNKARIELQELLYAEKLDRSAIDKKIDEISGYMKELSKNRANYWINIQQILTPEQRKILKERFGYGKFGFGPEFGFHGWAKPGRGLKLHRCW